jgi:hypothetical protein
MRLLIALLLLANVAEVRADPYDTESPLPKRWGYLVVDTISGRAVTQWRLDRTLTIDRLPLGRQTVLIRLPAGSYQWQEINIPYFNLPYRIDLFDDKRWAFRVDAQKVNYAGTLIVHETRASDSAGVRFVNRSSEVVGLLEQKFPELLQQFNLQYSGYNRDDFLGMMLGDEDRAAAQ